MIRTVNQAFETFLDRLIPTSAQRAAGAGHRASIKGALERHLDVSNFFESGSFTHGTGVRSRSDIDAFVSLKSKPNTSATALTWVRDAMQARFPHTPVKVRRPGVVVEFAGGYETWELIPAFITGRGTQTQFVYDIPNMADGWTDSAPKEHLAYVNACHSSAPKGRAKQLARLAKAWKYYCNVPISSFYLEMRAAQHVSKIDTYIHIWDICILLESLNSSGLAAMNDPSGASGRIYACGTTAQATDALSKLSTATTRARKALEAHRAQNDVEAFQYLDLLFGGHFPARSA